MANIKSINGNPIVVGTRQIEDSAVNGEKIAYNSLFSSHFQDNSVTENKIANYSVTTNKVAAGAITDTRLAQSSGVLDAVIDSVKLTSNLELDIEQSDIEQGGWTNTNKSSADNRIRVNRLLRVCRGQTITLVSNNRFYLNIYASLTASSASQTTGAWIDGPTHQPYTMTVSHDGYLACVFAASGNANLTPSDYDTTMTITSDALSSLDEIITETEAAKESVHGVIATSWEIGGYNSTGSRDRIKTVKTFPVKSGDTVGVYLSGGKTYRIGFITYVNGTYASGYSSVLPNAVASHEFTVPDGIDGTAQMGIMLVTSPSVAVSDADVEDVSNTTVVSRYVYSTGLKIYKFGGDGNDWCFVRLPDKYSPDRPKPYPFVICNHGNGWVMDGTAQKANWTKVTMYVPTSDQDYIDDPTQYNGTSDSSLWYSNPTIEALLAAGYIVCGCQNHADALYGNEQNRKACADFFWHMLSNYNVEDRCCMIGASNGAQTSINAAYILGERVKAMILQYPLTCLTAQYENYPAHQSGIRSAYGITNTSISEEDFIKATATHDLMHTNIADGAKVGYFPPTKIYYSESDTVTVATYNALAAYDLLYNSDKIVEKVQCTGEHGDASHFSPSAYVEFFNRF